MYLLIINKTIFIVILCVFRYTQPYVQVFLLLGSYK